MNVMGDLVPAASGQTLSTNENTALPITLSATDSDGDALTYSILTGPAHGTLTATGNGTYSYTPDANYHGADSFTFWASDGSNSSNVATVSINVVDNSVPVASSQTLSTNENTALPIDRTTVE